jgi:hypothetical protein
LIYIKTRSLFVAILVSRSMMMREALMFTKPIIAVAALLVLAAMAPSRAKEADVPTIDLQKFCKETAVIVLNDNPQTDLDVCMNDQKAARDQLVKDWASYPALARQRCVKPGEYRSAYIEWLTCIEMTRDVIKMRKERPETRVDRTLGRACPIVKVGDDGSIYSVDACQLTGQ